MHLQKLKLMCLINANLFSIGVISIFKEYALKQYFVKLLSIGTYILTQIITVKSIYYNFTILMHVPIFEID